MTKLDQFDRLETCLWRLTCELKFVANLVDTESEQALELRGDEIYVVVTQVVRQLEIAKRIVRRLFETNAKREGHTRRR